MPTRPPRPCNRAGCRELTHARFCERHRRAYEAQRPTATARGYGAAWRVLRAQILTRDPLCVECRRASSTDVDHIVERARGGTDDPSNLRGLCHGCHSRRTARESGGFRERGEGQCLSSTT